MTSFQLQILDQYDGLQQFITGVTEKAVWGAAIKAGNTSLRRLKTESGRRVRAERKLKAKTVNSRLDIFLASSRRGRGRKTAAATWRLGVSGRAIPLYEYGARQTQKGVSFNVSGQRETLKHAFIATMASGHTGVFERIPGTRMPSNPRKQQIEELFSTRVSDVFQNTGFIPRTQEFFSARFNDEWQRLIPVEIDRAKKRAQRAGARRR